jgi:RND family efflux transporter MFP subunit
MYVYWDIDERTLLRIRRLVTEGKVPTRQEGTEIPVLIELADEDDFPHKGIINFSENKVDASTGTLRIRAVIDNPKSASGGLRTLSPGLFVRVRLPVGSPRRSMLVPEQAVGTDQGNKFLYVVNDKNEVEYRRITVGKLDRGMRVIDKGVSPGEKVVVNGLQRIRPGAKVEPKLAEPPERPKSADTSPPPAPAGDESTITRHSAGG